VEAKARESDIVVQQHNATAETSRIRHQDNFIIFESRDQVSKTFDDWKALFSVGEGVASSLKSDMLSPKSRYLQVNKCGC